MNILNTTELYTLKMVKVIYFSLQYKIGISMKQRMKLFREEKLFLVPLKLVFNFSAVLFQWFRVHIYYIINSKYIRKE